MNRTARRCRPSTPRPPASRLVAIVLAALLAAGLASTPAPSQAKDALQTKIDKVLGKARKALLRDLKSSRHGELALVCLAALHDGLNGNDKTFAKAIERLSRSKIGDTYGLALRLMVARAYPDFPDRDEVAKNDLATLLTHQCLGGFSYHPNDGWWDLSNTQYAALGLRAALGLGLEVPERAWKELLASVLDAQKPNGGFCYRPDQGKNQTYSSMTVAGIAVLEICRQGLGLSTDDRPDVQRAIDRAWKWMDLNVGDIGRRNVRACLYFHYGLERAAILSQKKEVGGRDWYRTGAGMIVRMQRRSGAFRSVNELSTGDDTVPTAFAVLFLRRKFQREVRGPATQERTVSTGFLPAQATKAEVDRAIAFDVRRGEAAVPDLLKAMKDPLLVRRRAAAMALIRVTGVDFRYHPKRSNEANADAFAAAEAWWRAREEARRAGRSGGG